MKSGGIYLILHASTGNVYVGQTNCFLSRWKRHRIELAESRHHNSQLQGIWDKEGRQALQFQVLESLPDGLSALERQRWLFRRELAAWEQYHSKGLALNIVRPEIFETSEALKEFQQEEKIAVKSINSGITDDLRKVKAALGRAKSDALQSQRDCERTAQEVKKLQGLIWRNTGWRGFLFGKALTKTVMELQSDLQKASAELASLEEVKKKADSLAKSLEDRRRDLYASYPRNADRQMRRMEFYSTGTIRKTKIS